MQAAETYAAIKAMDKDAQKKACSTFRKDGKVIEMRVTTLKL